jgi:hypothetical protein
MSKLPDNKYMHEKAVKEGRAKAKTKVNKNQINVQWWLANDEDLPQAVMAQALAVTQADMNRLRDYNIFTRLYGGQEGTDAVKVNANTAPSKERMGFNVASSCVDTLVAKVAKAKPKPFFQTIGGDHNIVRRAKKLDKLCGGIFYENKAYYQMPLAFRDACVYGTGIIWVGDVDGRVRFERVQPWEILVDYLECLHGPEFAKTVRRVRDVDRVTLQARYPEHEAAIAATQNTNHMLYGTEKSVADTVTVIESWRLPSYDGADDGMYCVTTGSTVLCREPYSKMHFPFATIRFSPRLQGWHGQGLVEQLVPIQFELNQCLMVVQRSYWLGGTYKILVPDGSKIVDSHFDGNVGTIIKYAQGPGGAPTYITPPLVQGEIYEHIQRLIQFAYQQSGVSQLSANSSKPAGLNSGEALRTFDDIETDRFQLIGQMYEDLALQLANLAVDTAADIAEYDPSFSVRSPDRKFISTIKWSEVDMPRDVYVLQIAPVSKLPSEPAGQIQTVTEWMQSGLVTQTEGRQLLDSPDLPAYEALVDASNDYLHKILDDIVDSGKPAAIEPDDDPVAARKLALEYLQQGKCNNLNPDRLQMLRDFISSIDDMVQASQPPVPPPGVPGAPGAPHPIATPQQPPTSDTLPIGGGR